MSTVFGSHEKQKNKVNYILPDKKERNAVNHLLMILALYSTVLTKTTDCSLKTRKLEIMIMSWSLKNAASKEEAGKKGRELRHHYLKTNGRL